MKLRTIVQNMIAGTDMLTKEVDLLKPHATEEERKILAQTRLAIYNAAAPLRKWENKMTDERAEFQVPGSKEQ